MRGCRLLDVGRNRWRNRGKTGAEPMAELNRNQGGTMGAGPPIPPYGYALDWYLGLP